MKILISITLIILINADGGKAVTCPAQYTSIGNGCYSFPESPSSWFDASLACQFSGGSLANIDSDVEQSDLKDYHDAYLNASPFKIRWIGATDSVTPGTWRWTPSGATLSYSNWLEGSPSSEANRHCAFWDSIGNTWNNYMCCVTVNNVASLCEANPISVV